MSTVINIYNDTLASMPACVVKESVPAVDTDLIAVNVIKAADERRYTLGLAYPAMVVDKAVAQDGHRDFVSAEALEKTAWEFLKGGGVNMFHKQGTDGHADVVESYIYRGPDWKFTSPVDGNSYVVKAGDWMLGTVWDDHGWQMVKAGLVNGWSPEGGARRTKPTPERLAQVSY
jgi:hypothetical protein